ncbi:MAG: histidine kinase [Caldilineae bacterium]|nr:MAG: histidine kinase [Caldilineae bacterium]
MNLALIGLLAIGYIGILFAIAYYGDVRAERGRSLISTPHIYALSLAVYCTAWTFYGSVGRAASSGPDFLPIYLGPTLMAALWWFVLRKMIRISKIHRITSIADLIASRYGKSTFLGGLVTVVAVIGIIPYISLQLKAVSISFTLLWHYPNLDLPEISTIPVLRDTGFYVALLMATFAILFGTRHLDATEHHEGLVLAIAFESVVKLLAFLTVGAFVVYGMFNGVGELFRQANGQPELQALLSLPEGPQGYENWFWLTFLSMMAILFLPRQFQMAVVENVNERHLETAIWLFPLYLWLINLFVLPIALAGRLLLPETSGLMDMYVLLVPLAQNQPILALLAFLGGLSAATGMIIVETVALSTMVSNDLIFPWLLRTRLVRPIEQAELPDILLLLRRGIILVVVLLGYLYFRVTGESVSLVSIGLISFAAVAQFAPALLGGIFWKGGTRVGALAGLLAGFGVWMYTLPVPSLVSAGLLGESFITQGPAGIAWLRPYALFGLDWLDPVPHALFWSMSLNTIFYLLGSLWGHQNVLEHSQAARFVDVFRRIGADDPIRVWSGTASTLDLQTLLERFLGRLRAGEILDDYARQRGVAGWRELEADPEMVEFVERLLAGTIGAASARVAVASIVTEEPVNIDEVIHMLDETSQVVAYSRQLEEKSRQLEATTAELREANQRLQELDRLKDEFISTVTHELRTPLTSIRAMTEILCDNPDLALDQREQFLQIVLKESERLSRLINQVLDFAKIESGTFKWNLGPVDVLEVVNDAVTATRHLFDERGVALQVETPDQTPIIQADYDRLMQVLLNLLSNAAKFAVQQVHVSVQATPNQIRVDVQDDGPGIPPEHQESIFEKFHQVHSTGAGRPRGTGLGLPISRHIISQLGGRLWVESTPGAGATFSFLLPVHEPASIVILSAMDIEEGPDHA